MQATTSLTYRELVELVDEADTLGRAAAAGEPLTRYRVTTVGAYESNDVVSGLSGWATVEIRDASRDLRRALGLVSSRARRLSLSVDYDLGRGVGRAYESRLAYANAFAAHLRAAGLRAFVFEALS